MTRRTYPKYKDSGIPWLREIPIHWGATSVKRLYSIQLGKMLQNSLETVEDQRVPYLKALNVHWGVVDTEDPPEMWASQNDIRQYGVADGDLLVCEGGEVGRAGIVLSAPTNCIIQNALHRVRALTDTNVCFLMYVLHTACSSGWFSVLCNKATIAHFTSDKFGDLNIPAPPPSEQRAIAAFLDRETARIDGLIEKKQRQLELLQEKRAALISHAVTKGLDPTANMKSSGIEWLGDVPAHWEVMKLRRVTKSRCDGPFGSGLKSEHYRDEGIRVVRLQNIRFARFDDADEAFIAPEYYRQLGDHDVRPGDLLIAGLGDDNYPVGRACVAPSTISPAMVKADCFRFRIDQEMANPAYLAFQLSTAAVALNGAFAKGTTRARTNLSDMSDRPLVLPPSEEQRAIAVFLEQQTVRIDALTAKVEHSIAMIREYRTALISAAVTGKIDVREEGL